MLRLACTVLGLLVVTMVAESAHGDEFDLSGFRQRIASDRALGFAEGQAVLQSGALDSRPDLRRLLLFYMGGAAVGAADDDWLAAVLDGLAAQQDAEAAALAGLVRGARLLDRGEAGEGLVEVLQSANQLQAAEDAELQGIVSAELCRSYSAAGHHQAGLPHCQRHEQQMAASGDPSRLARAHYLHAAVLSNAGRPELAVPKWRAARALFIEQGLDSLADRTSGSLATDLNALGEYLEAREAASQALAAAERTGSARSLAVARGVLGEALLGLGELDAAIEMLEQALLASAGLMHVHLDTYLLEQLQRALQLQDPDAHADRIAELRARRAELELVQPSEQLGDEIARLERELRQRELDLRIRELEQEAYLTQVELERFRVEAERRAEVLHAQRVAIALAVVAALALAGALLASALLLRAQRRLAATLRDQAYRDVLTGLPNRRALIEALARPSEGRALLLVDIDHFKAINDRGGHAHGDSVLASVARCLQQQAPAGALLARLGGEEFVLLAEHLDVQQALALAERLRLAVAGSAHGSPGSEEPAGRVTVSIGLALLDANTTTADGEWMRRADAALYRAKAGGRNRVELA